MDEAEEAPSVEITDPEMRQMLGMFDVPAFARRGQDLEYALRRLGDRCERERESMLEMVRLRLRQWSRVVTGPDDWRAAFSAPIDALWLLTGTDPPAWSDQEAPPRRQVAVARNLVASVNRFNRRWDKFITEINLDFINRSIDQYNHYYVLEKECCLGSARLAARHFVPRPLVSPENLLADYPLLPVPKVNVI
jgi:hypothetical protein